MIEIEKPRVEIAEVSDDEKYGRIVIEPHYARQLFKTYSSFVASRRCGEQYQD